METLEARDLLALVVTPITLSVGSPFKATIATFKANDVPGPAVPTSYSATINWGDGVTADPAVIAAGAAANDFVVNTRSPGHTYAHAGSYTTAVTLQGSSGSPITATGAATVTDPPPTVSPATVVLASAGLPFRGVVASFTEADASLDASKFAATIDWGDKSQATAGKITRASGGGFEVSGTHTYAAVAISNPVTIKVVRLPDGARGEATAQAVVTNASTPATGLPIKPAAGLPFTNPVATFMDSDPSSTASDFTATIDWGDGSIPDAGTIGEAAGAYYIKGDHIYTKEKSVYKTRIAITRTVTGQVYSASGTATVVAAALNLKPLAISPSAETPFADPVATFTDANPSAEADDYTATVDWGDGTTSPTDDLHIEAVKPADGGGFSVAGRHAYAVPGSYTVNVAVERTADKKIVTDSTTADVKPSVLARPTTITPVAGRPFTSVVATFDVKAPASPRDFVATIDWGDGTPAIPSSPTAGVVVARPGGGFAVVGSYAYGLGSGAKPYFPVTVTIDSSLTSVNPAAPVTSKAVVQAPGFTGGMDPTTDTGASHADGVTRINQPTFLGTATPFSLVQLYVQGRGMTAPTLLGQATSGGDGTWRVYTTPLGDGYYTVTAHVTPPSGAPPVVQNLAPILIDTVAPRVLGVAIDRGTHQVQVTFRDDLSGVDPATQTNPRNYNILAGGRAHYATSQAPVIASAQIVPTDPTTAVVNLVPPPGLRGAARLRVLAGGIADVAGNPLAGAGAPGTNYVATLSLKPPARPMFAVHGARRRV